MEDLLAAFGLLLLGWLFLAVELFVVPGFGFFGIAGIVLVAIGCVVTWTQRGAVAGVVVIGLSTVMAVGAIVWLVRSRTGRRMVLQNAVTGEATDREGMQRLVGREGVASSVLRPSGTALIDGERYQVVSDGEFVTAGTKLRVVRMGTNCLIVEPLADDAGDAPEA